MKLVLKIVLSVFVLFVLLAGGGIFYLTRGLDTGSELVINTVNLSNLSDDKYIGNYNNGRWSNVLSVIVKDHKIVKIDIVEDVMLSRPELTKELFNNVIEKQNTDVDVISEATVTSKAYLKSIEDALTK